MNYSRRSQNLASKIQFRDITCCVITSPPNLRYLFNYSGQAFERFCCGLMNKDCTKSALVIPKLDLEKSSKSHVDNVFPWTDSEGYSTALSKALESVGTRNGQVGCEASLTLSLMDQLRTGFGQDSLFIQISDEISSLRLIKDKEEISSIKDAAAKLSRVYKSIPDIIRPGKSESEISLEIIKQLLRRGLRPFDYPLVQSGPDSAVPHSEPGKRKINRGDMVVVDTSATNEDGYFADLTRTYVVGRPTQKQEQVYDSVRRAQSDAAKSIRLGMELQQVDRSARSTIEKLGYGNFFIHRTGHGLGLEVHEAPFLRDGNSSTIERGMVFTVEPGIYLQGKFGVRIEDNIVMGSTPENVTELSHELIQI
jgi:Xaa-Pro dipeptidase